MGACYLLLGLMYAIALGFLTHATLYQLQEQSRDDRIDAIVHADLAGSALKLCVEGVPADQTEPTRFGIVVPDIDLRRLAAGGIDGVELSYLGDRLTLSREWVQPRCDEAAARIAHRRVQLTGSAGLFVIPGLEDLQLGPELDRPSVVLAALEHPRNKTTRNYLVAVLEGEPDARPHYVLLATEPVLVPGSRLWLLVVPFALLGDAISFPIQVVMWLYYAGAH